MPKVISKTKKKTQHHPEARGLIFLGISLVLLCALGSFVQGRYDQNWLGIAGYVVAYGMHYVLGLCSYLVVFFLAFIGWRLIKSQNYQGAAIKLLYFVLFSISCCMLLNVVAETHWIDFSWFHSNVYSEKAVLDAPLPLEYVRYNLGGVPFYYLYRDVPHCNLQRLLSDLGVALTFSILGIVSFILLTDLSFVRAIKYCLKIFPYLYESIIDFLGSILKLMRRLDPEEAPLFAPAPSSTLFNKPKERKEHKAQEVIMRRVKEKPFEEKIAMTLLPLPAPTLKPKVDLSTSKAPNIRETNIYEPKEESSKTEENFKEKKKKESLFVTNYEFPPLSLLTDTKKVDQTGLKKELKARADILEETLTSFGIEAKVGNIHCGPTITSFEVHPAIGVKVQKIKALENDIALNLQAKSIRIIAPIPGKAAVGVEVPSLYPQEVGFKEMLAAYRKVEHKYHIPMLLGKTVSGEDVLCDLTKMPHCIIAGATGSGKSVCINTIIMSILMNASPEEVKLILIDPKKVELTPFSGLPHLIAPVITEPRGAYAALQWVVKEMQFRYDILKKLGVRNVNAFNRRTVDKEFEASLDLKIPEKMHFIVMIIDEFADLMMTSSADLETPIARIAQMARAVGIHLILATQRPSREVITGLIKANFPTRISFKVSSRINSQIILDENGAESLLGNGDMLFLPPGTSQLTRCQGVFIRDEDINRVISHILNRRGANYLFESFDAMGEAAALSAEDEESSGTDPLYNKAMQLVFDHRIASTTFIQRKLKVGYARAASLMDELEESGIIGPQDGSKPRKILKDFPGQ